MKKILNNELYLMRN